LGIGLTPMTPSGMRIRSLLVAAPAQPWGTRNTALWVVPTAASGGSSVTWAGAAPAPNRSAAEAAAIVMVVFISSAL